MPFLNGGTSEDASKYCTKVLGIPRLTKDQEIELGQRLKANRSDEWARNELITHNLGLSVVIAHKYVGCGLSFSDLIQEGNLGLIRAANTYDPDEGVRFGTYAYYVVKHRIYGAISRTSRLVRIPQKTRLMSSNIRRGKMPTKRTLKKRLKYLNMTTVDELANLSMYREVSIDKELSSGHSGNPVVFKNMLVDPKALVSFMLVDETDFRDKRGEILSGMLKTLKPKDQEILEMIFGLNGREPLNLRQIGRIYGCTFQNIYARYLKSLHKLRRMQGRLHEYAPI